MTDLEVVHTYPVRIVARPQGLEGARAEEELRGLPVWDLVETVGGMLKGTGVEVKWDKRAKETGAIVLAGDATSDQTRSEAVAAVDGKTVKLRNVACRLVLVVKAQGGRRKVDWERYFFKGERAFETMLEGERPDTLFVKGLPIEWFQTDTHADEVVFVGDRVNKEQLKAFFDRYGKVKAIDVEEGEDREWKERRKHRKREAKEETKSKGDKEREREANGDRKGRRRGKSRSPIPSGKSGSESDGGGGRRKKGEKKEDPMDASAFNVYVQYADYEGFCAAMEVFAGAGAASLGLKGTSKKVEIEADFDRSRFMSAHHKKKRDSAREIKRETVVDDRKRKRKEAERKRRMEEERKRQLEQQSEEEQRRAKETQEREAREKKERRKRERLEAERRAKEQQERELEMQRQAEMERERRGREEREKREREEREEKERREREEREERERQERAAREEKERREREEKERIIRETRERELRKLFDARRKIQQHVLSELLHAAAAEIEEKLRVEEERREKERREREELERRAREERLVVELQERIKENERLKGLLEEKLAQKRKALEETANHRAGKRSRGSAMNGVS